jgi:hypothetical protein
MPTRLGTSAHIRQPGCPGSVGPSRPIRSSALFRSGPRVIGLNRPIVDADWFTDTQGDHRPGFVSAAFAAKLGERSGWGHRTLLGARHRRCVRPGQCRSTRRSWLSTARPGTHALSYLFGSVIPRHQSNRGWAWAPAGAAAGTVALVDPGRRQTGVVTSPDLSSMVAGFRFPGEVTAGGPLVPALRALLP